MQDQENLMVFLLAHNYRALKRVKGSAFTNHTHMYIVWHGWKSGNWFAELRERQDGKYIDKGFLHSIPMETLTTRLVVK